MATNTNLIVCSEYFFFENLMFFILIYCHLSNLLLLWYDILIKVDSL